MSPRRVAITAAKVGASPTASPAMLRIKSSLQIPLAGGGGTGLNRHDADGGAGAQSVVPAADRVVGSHFLGHHAQHCAVNFTGAANMTDRQWVWRRRH